jgi:D-Tyr-tRNAtyr deacylase
MCVDKKMDFRCLKLVFEKVKSENFEILSISQFTLYGKVTKGTKPGLFFMFCVFK